MSAEIVTTVRCHDAPTFPVLCAWCDAKGVTTILFFSSVEHSHGICRACAHAVLADRRTTAMGTTTYVRGDALLETLAEIRAERRTLKLHVLTWRLDTTDAAVCLDCGATYANTFEMAKDPRPCPGYQTCGTPEASS